MIELSNRVPETEPPILILSCYRTGSTLLRFIVDTHPEVYSPPESSLGRAAFDLAVFSFSIRGMRYDVDNIRQVVPPDLLAWIREVLGSEMNAAAARKGKRIWCEKTPGNLIPSNLNVLNQVFSDARCLCLHRHALDVVQSLIKIMHRLPDLQPFLMRSGVITAAINYWIERTATLLEQEENNRARCFRVRYEDLVAEPAKVLESMFRFLDLSWDESLITRVFDARHDRGMDDIYIPYTNSIHARSIGAGRSVSLKGVPEKTLEAMRSLLRRLDYPDLPSPVSSSNASAASSHDVRWFFETHLPRRIQQEPDLCTSLAASYRFVVTGDEGGSWVFDPSQARVAAGESGARCTAELSSDDLFAIARGELHPWKAAEQRRLRLSGEIRFQELEKLVRLLFLPQAESGSPS